MNTHDFLQWLLSASLRASVLALVVLGLQFSLGRWLPARWRHAMWLPVVLVLLAPVLPESRFSVENGFLARTDIAAIETLPDAVHELSLDGQSMTAPATGQQAGWPWIFAAWLLGAVGVLGMGGVGYVRSVRRISHGTMDTSLEVTAAVSRATHEVGLKRPPGVIMSSAVDSPAVAGLLRPVLLLPAGFPAGFSANEARMILLHELTHLKRHDLPVNWLLCVLQALHWFNPLLWLAFARMRADRETACDAQVLGAAEEDRRADYGHALIKLQSSIACPGPGLGFVGIFDRVGIRSRIRAIAMHRRANPAWGLVAALLIAAITLVGGTRAQDASADKSKNAPEAALTQPVDQLDKPGWGTFVSFKDGTLTLKGAGGGLVWKGITEKTPVFHWDGAARDYKPAGPAEAMGKVEAGTWIFVAENRELIRVGAAKEGHVSGTFVSYKSDRMLLLGINLAPSNFTRKYGNQLNFPKFAENVPVFESTDGGEHKLAGSPSTVLPGLKEGTIVTVYYGPADGSFIRIEVGVKK